MATQDRFLEETEILDSILQQRNDEAEEVRNKRFNAVICLQRYVRIYLIKKHIKYLSHKATIIQTAFRRYKALKTYRIVLIQAVYNAHNLYYKRAAIKLQALWRGYYSRRTKFCYRTYREWLATIKERGERRAAEAVEFGVRSRADDLKILEEESRQWLAFVVFKLHHLLRTYSRAGVYSEPATTELSDFEKLLNSIHYKEYMKRLKRKYDAFVRKHRPAFSSKKLFPIIGDGADYWYLSLPEMYELTRSPKIENTRHKAVHHSNIHKEPFLWKKVKPPGYVNRGPFTLPQKTKSVPPPPCPSVCSAEKDSQDPRFHLYVKYYKPDPALFDYVNFHINVVLKRKFSIQAMTLESE